MTQTVKGSMVESLANIAVGFTVNWAANMVILPHYDCKHLTGLMAFEMGLWFTLVSLVRQFVIRRWFNGLKFGNKEVRNG